MKYNEIKNILLASARGTFGLTNLMKAGFSYKQGSDLLKLIHNDRDFIRITFDNNMNSWRFTSFKHIIAPFVEINLRPLGTFTELITDEKIRGYIGIGAFQGQCLNLRNHYTTGRNWVNIKH